MENIKEIVVQDYSLIAQKANDEGSEEWRKNICKPIYDFIDAQYKSFTGYQPDADLGLGCAFPFQYAGIKTGDEVLDLGCAAGIDCFIMREMVGDEGTVTGIDITNALIHKAKSIAEKNQFNNIHFVTGDIEQLPFDTNAFDVITTNGVFSLLPHKQKAFHEVYRILKPGGTFCFADIARKTNYPDALYEKIKAFTGCLNGIYLLSDYLQEISNAGFSKLEILNERQLEIPGVEKDDAPLIAVIQVVK